MQHIQQSGDKIAASGSGLCGGCVARQEIRWVKILYIEVHRRILRFHR